MTDRKKIWCLFSVENDYDQPPHNLVAWWVERPSFEIVLDAIGGSLSVETSILAAAGILEGDERRVDNTDYRLVAVVEGKVKQ